jgi:hypothetical protein
MGTRLVLGVGASHSTLMNTHWDRRPGPVASLAVIAEVAVAAPGHRSGGRPQRLSS